MLHVKASPGWQGRGRLRVKEARRETHRGAKPEQSDATQESPCLGRGLLTYPANAKRQTPGSQRSFPA